MSEFIPDSSHQLPSTGSYIINKYDGLVLTPITIRWEFAVKMLAIVKRKRRRAT